LDKSLERLAENQVVQGASNQQYTITGANDLAYLLSNTLDQMQNSMPSSGKGGDSEFQLPDIIKKQEDLNGKMKDGAKKGNKPDDKEGEGKEGEKGKESGKESGKEGKEGGKEGNKDGEGENSQGEGEGEKGNNGKNGKDKGKEKGEGGDKEGDQFNEDLNGQLYQIYKEQQQLRNALEDKIKKEGVNGKLGSNVLRRMEQVEQELLEKGFNDNTLSKMLDLKHQLMKLEDATLKQGEDDKRESNSNKKEFENNNDDDLNRAKQYFNTTEILNRQVLPLRFNYKRKVQEYFKKDND